VGPSVALKGEAGSIVVVVGTVMVVVVFAGGGLEFVVLVEFVSVGGVVEF